MGKKLNANLVLENAILMSADIFAKLNEICQEESDCIRTARIIADESEELERKLLAKREKGEEYDYFEELEKHEAWVLKKWSIEDEDLEI